jgi:hypothetical protein
MGYQLPISPDSLTIAGHTVALGSSQNLAASDLTNGTTGSSDVVLATSPTITSPTLTSLNMTATPSLTATFPADGLTHHFMQNVTTTAAQGSDAEIAAQFNITSSVGSGDPLHYFKMALFAYASANAGSGNVYGANFVVRGGTGADVWLIGAEIDVDNSVATYDHTTFGADASSYGLRIEAAGAYASTAAIWISQGTGGAPYELWSTGFAATQDSIAEYTFYDLTNAPTVFKIDGNGTWGNHTAILDTENATATYLLLSPNFVTNNMSGITQSGIGNNAARGQFHAGQTSTTNICAFALENLSSDTGTNKTASIDWYGRDSINEQKLVGRIVNLPSDDNWAGGGTGGISIQPETSNGGVSEVARFMANGGVLIDSASEGITLGSSGPTLTSGSGVPSAAQPVGSLYLNTSGSTGSRLYVSAGGGSWNAVSGV